MINQAINYEDITLGELYDLYERHHNKKSYVCDADEKKIKVKLKYDFVKVVIKKEPPTRPTYIKRKRSTWKPYY